jgi:hypothetical protein
MAKRKTIQEKEVEALTQKHLNQLGRKIIVESKRNSKIAKSKENFTGGSLRDSGNMNVKPFNTINLYQNYYGKYNTPKGKPTPKDRDVLGNKKGLEDTPIRNSISDNLPDGIKFFVKDMIDLLKSPIIQKK